MYMHIYNTHIYVSINIYNKYITCYYNTFRSLEPSKFILYMFDSVNRFCLIARMGEKKHIYIYIPICIFSIQLIA